LDAIVDLLYVVFGAAIAYGFSPEQIDAAFAEVHRSNMTKFWTAEEVSHSTANLAFSSAGPAKWRAINENGKVIKSPGYSPANLGPIVEGGSR
jgi:predicted HAD superfamily Cof-like phosphohydrolase